MHEFSAAAAIVETVLRSSREQGAAGVLAIKLEIGELTFLNPEQLCFWITEGFKGTLAEAAELEVTSIKPVVRCHDCGRRGDLPFQDDPIFHYSHPIFACPSCNSTNIAIEKGKECLIRNIQVLMEEKDDA